MAVICYPCVYISLGDAALAKARVLKIGCYCSQNAVLQIAQNGLGGLGLTGYGPAGGPEFPPSCGSGPVAVGSGLWGRSQYIYIYLYMSARKASAYDKLRGRTIDLGIQPDDTCPAPRRAAAQLWQC